MPGYRKNARAYLRYFQVFVLPSLTEGLPITLLEAMQEGVPVVATRAGGIPHVIENGRSGVLVDSHDARALSEGILRMLCDEHNADRMRRQAEDIVKQNFTSAAMARQYADVYKAVSDRCLN
jgi:glycosyltransferase involved in cell wall biosynthesis